MSFTARMHDSTFAGPLLLNALLKYLGQSSAHPHHDEGPLARARAQTAPLALHSFLDRGSIAYGACLVALLGLTAVLKARADLSSAYRSTSAFSNLPYPS